MILIGFNGKMGCGKSTAVEAVQQFFERDVVLVKFAQPLYDIQEYAYNRISSVYKRPSSFIKDRKLLQWIGTEWGRDSISPSLWGDIWEAEVKFLRENVRNVVIVCDDLRFDNEGERFKRLGGYVIKIDRDDNTAHAHGGVGIANHASEAGIRPDLIDFTVSNNGTLQEYQDSLRKLLSQLVGRSDKAPAA